jgi:4-hydroxy-3-methylbut-2-enyl diphosphate reductase
MKIIIGKMAGFCSGVQRAIKGVKNELTKNEKLYCYGEIIHNQEVVESLEQYGMETTDSIGAIPDGSRFVIRTHGLPLDLVEEARKKKLQIYDVTCPKVKKIHHLVTQLTKEGCHIFIVGNPHHPEVKAILSLTHGNAQVVEKPEEVELPFRGDENAVVVQTTFNPDVFFKIVLEIIAVTKKTMVYNTLCEETIKRQREAMALAAKVDFVSVVGGRNSSNTKTLFNIVRGRVPAVHIENAAELQKSWFNNVKSVGILSGASTPKDEVQKAYERIKSFAEELGHKSKL